MSASATIPSQVGRSPWQDAWLRLRKNRLAVAGAGLVVAFALLCALGPLFAQSYQVQNLNLGATGPGAAHWLGTDTLGRDLLARVVYGARTSLVTAAGATVLTRIWDEWHMHWLAFAALGLVFFVPAQNTKAAA